MTNADNFTSEITFLHSYNGPVLTKVFRLDSERKIQKSKIKVGSFFSVKSIGLDNIADLSMVLEHLEEFPHHCVIRGQLKDGIDPERTIRKSNGSDATFESVPRSWIMLDMDEIPAPALTDPATDPEDSVEYLIGLLPEEFWDSSCYWSFSSSQGFKGDTLSVHMWFWLDRPISDSDLKRWGESVNSGSRFGKLIDVSLFNPVQIHYTSNPIFHDGIINPIPRRSGVREGLVHEVSIKIPDMVQKPILKGAGSDSVGIGAEGYLERIGGSQGFFNPIKSAIGSMVRAGTDPEIIKTQIRERVQSADHGNRNIQEIERYQSDEFLDEIIQKFSSNIPEPYYPRPNFETCADAEVELSKIISEFLSYTTNATNAKRELKRMKEESDKKFASDFQHVFKTSDDEKSYSSCESHRKLRQKIEEESLLKNLNVGKISLVNVTPGVGKTSTTLRELSKLNEPMTICYLTDTKKLAEEGLKKYRSFATATSLPSMIIRGRDSEDPDRD